MAFTSHPLADIFPMMTDEEFASLVKDIKANGLQEAVVLHEGMILDGRNRYAACVEIGIEPITKTWDGRSEPLAYVLSKNLHRRHLSDSQRAIVAGKIATMKQGARTDLPPIGGRSVSQPSAATLMNVSERSVSRAKVVLDRGVPELKAAVETGSISLKAAEEVARCPEEEQRMVVAKEPKRIAEYANRIREERREEKQQAKVGRKTKQPLWGKERRKQASIDADIWADLKEGFEKFGNLPLASDVARIARQRDRANLVDQRLDRTLQWLEDFRNAWNSKRSEDAA